MKQMPKGALKVRARACSVRLDRQRYYPYLRLHTLFVRRLHPLLKMGWTHRPDTVANEDAQRRDGEVLCVCVCLYQPVYHNGQRNMLNVVLLVQGASEDALLLPFLFAPYARCSRFLLQNLRRVRWGKDARGREWRGLGGMFFSSFFSAIQGWHNSAALHAGQVSECER